jgi:hypothetical protein
MLTFLDRLAYSLVAIAIIALLISYYRGGRSCLPPPRNRQKLRRR